MEVGEFKNAFLALSNRELAELLTMREKAITERTSAAPGAPPRWFELPLRGLTAEGESLLSELESDSRGFAGSHVDRKQLRYLRQLKRMWLDVPSLFRQIPDPKKVYRALRVFCLANDIPVEIVSQVVPAIVQYIETGRMRPILFVGEKGCGKTTSVKLLMNKALQLEVEVIKAPQMGASHGLTGDAGTFQSADVGAIERARLQRGMLLMAFLVDEIDKVPRDRTRCNLDEELLSITDESVFSMMDQYTQTQIVGLQHCPFFFTANDLSLVNPILVDRCHVIHFPAATADRLKSMMKKYVEQKRRESSLLKQTRFDYERLNLSIDRLLNNGISSLRKHQQVVEHVFSATLDLALYGKTDDPVYTTGEMFLAAEEAVLDSEVTGHRAGFL